jgi:predicted glycoside hydrolase/deacetylase ChbG (UPF0249 family)
MANGAALDYAVKLAREHTQLGVGVHLNLVEGRPLCSAADVPSLLGSDGNFLPKFALIRRQLRGRLSLDELRKEVEAQIDCVRNAGIEPTHVDAHKNIHAYPPFFTVVAHVAASRAIAGIRVPLERPRFRDWFASPTSILRTTLLNGAAWLSRRKLRSLSLTTTDAFAGTLRTGNVTAGWLLSWFSSLDGGSVELMVHPGKCDEELLKMPTRLTTHRETELNALTDQRVKDAIKHRGIELSHFGRLTSRKAVPRSVRQAESLVRNQECVDATKFLRYG